MSQRDRGMPTPPQSEQEANPELEARIQELKKHISGLIERIKKGELAEDESLRLLGEELNNLGIGDLEAWDDFSRKYKKTLKGITEFSKSGSQEEEHDFAESPISTDRRLEDSRAFSERIGGFEKKGMNALFKAWIRNRFTALKGLIDEYNQLQVQSKNAAEADQLEADEKEIVSDLVNNAETYLMPNDLKEVMEEISLLKVFSNSSKIYRQ